MQCPDQVLEAVGCVGVPQPDPGALSDCIQLPDQGTVQTLRIPVVAARKTEPQHGMADRPVPAPMNCQAPEKLPVSPEQLIQRVEEQALSEPTRTRQEIVLSLPHEAQEMLRLIDIVEPLLPYLAEGLGANRKLAGRTIGKA